MAVSAARSVAYDILFKVEQQDSYASELLHSHRLDALSPQDRGLCTELVMGVLRWRSVLDDAIAKASSKQVSRLDAEVRIALQIAIYQFMFLERVPTHAAVNESVELVKRARKRSAVPFANAVLRKASADAERPKPPDASASSRQVANSYAHPAWLVDRWREAYGPLVAERICAFDQLIPVTAIRLRDDSVEAELRAEGIELAPGELISRARRVVTGDITRTKAFAERRIAIQDEASQMVALVVGRGIRLLDCCAAPGSKTAALAWLNPEAQIVAAEIHPHRAALLRERVPQKNVEVLTSDATSLPYGAEFDRVLVDVPCTGTGTLARNPEIKWKLRLEDIADLRHRQLSILKAALNYAAPGGRIVYSTCSLENEENSSVIEELLPTSTGFRLLDATEELRNLRDAGELAWSDIASLTRGPYLRTLPGMHPSEGFFAAILQRD
jgi:16S rRNA (cytosine967-C5)-methyltransferase